jgi:flagellar basal body P-ring formation protein FlgA
LKRIALLATFVICASLCVAVSFAADSESQWVQNAIQEYIEANMPWPKGTARVTILSAEMEAVPQGKNITLRIEPSGSEDFIGDTTFAVRFFKSGNFLRTESVRTKIEVLHDVVVAVRQLSSGTVLADADIRTVRKWIQRVHPHALSSMDEAVGRRLTTQTKAGGEIYANMLKDVPLVQKGKIVKIIFDSGMMRIVTIGIPEEDGMAGNLIRVRNITSNKIIYARVLGTSLVSIEL